ncbi:MAG: acyl carrier protein [Chloroflexi bacterium]|nr:acyl carrier protein [Chloroflexota bacterium]MYD49525.1 acyl carrier protein [Chloroflexota bacterium]
MSNVSQRAVKVIAAELRIPESSVTPEATFDEDLGADSLALTRLAAALETEFSCVILDDDADVITTVGGMVGYIEGRLNT